MGPRTTASKVSPVITLRSAATVPPIVTPLAPLTLTPSTLVVDTVGTPFVPTPMKLPVTAVLLELTAMAMPVNPTRSSPSTLLPAAGASKISPLSTVPPPVDDDRQDRVVTHRQGVRVRGRSRLGVALEVRRLDDVGKLLRQRDRLRRAPRDVELDDIGIAWDRRRQIQLGDRVEERPEPRSHWCCSLCRSSTGAVGLPGGRNPAACAASTYELVLGSTAGCRASSSPPSLGETSAHAANPWSPAWIHSPHRASHA